MNCGERFASVSCGTCYSTPAAIDTGISRSVSQTVSQTSHWRSLGDPWPLFFRVMNGVCRQYAALGVMTVLVTYSGEHLMDCKPQSLGNLGALVCESSKAFVKGFPVFGMVVSLMVAGHLILRIRIYYAILETGTILDFDNVSPWSDPLFLGLLFFLAHAAGHFALNIWTKGQGVNISGGAIVIDHDLVSEATWLAVNYFVPALVFLVFLSDSYDTEALLVPVNKYFEVDPEAARAVLGSAKFVSESAAALVATRGLRLEDSTHGSQCPAEVGYKQLVARALEYGEGGTSQSSPSTPGRRAPPELSRWHLVSTLWPVPVLLDERLEDESGFRQMWWIFMVLSATLTAAALLFLVLFAWQDAHAFASGKQTVISAIIVHVVTGCMFVLLLHAYFGNIRSMSRPDFKGVHLGIFRGMKAR